MSSQINVRFPENLLESAQDYATEHGYNNIQDFIRETVREKLFDPPSIEPEELKLVLKLLNASKLQDLFGTEEELFEKLK